jgi:HEAT repeat protein
LRSDLLDGEEFPRLRLEGLSVSASLGTADYLAALVRLADDPDIRVREAVADGTRGQTERIHKTVMRKTYTFVDPKQNPRVFALLKTLSKDEAPTVRTKAAYALGDHPGTKTATILERLSLDPDEQVRKAADHAKGRLSEQAAIASAYEAAVGEKAAKARITGSRKGSKSKGDLITRKDRCG